MGKPTIMLTEQIHSTMANCISLKNYKSFDKIFNKAEEISGWDGNKKNSSFIKWIKKYSGCFIQSGLYWKYIKFYLDGDYDLGANNIKNAVIDYCEKS